MFGAHEFGPDFQRVLVRTCVDDPELRGLVGRFIADKQLAFTDPASGWAWDVIMRYDHPTVLVIATEAGRLLDNDPARVGVQSIITASDWRDSNFVRTQIVEWARRQLFKLGFEEARQHWNAGQAQVAMDAMMRRIEELNDIRILDADRGWFFEDFDRRQLRRAAVDEGTDYFTTGIPVIDKAMRGGLHYGELGVPIAYSKIGKTFWCIQSGVLGARMRRRVLHFVLEGGRKKTEDRYEAAFSQTLYVDVRRGAFASELADALRREYAILAGNLVTRGFAEAGAQWQVSYAQILEELATLRRSKGWVPDLIIVDYGDLVDAPGDSERDRQKAAFRSLKSLSERVDFSGHRGYAVWAPSQAQRPDKGADTREHVLKPRDIADCYEKVRVADAILTLNRTEQEKKYNQARVSLGAYRDAEDGALVRVTTDYDHGMFCKLGEEREPHPPPPPTGDAPASERRAA